MPQTLSTLATNVTANPQVPNEGKQIGKDVKVAFETVTVPDTANADTHISGVRIPVNARVLSVQFGCDDLGTAGTIDLGLFKRDGRNVNTFTAVSANTFGDNIDVATSAVTIAERLNVAKMGDLAWDLAGLSAAPDYDHFYVGITTDTGTTQAGAAHIRVMYVLD